VREREKRRSDATRAKVNGGASLRAIFNNAATLLREELQNVRNSVPRVRRFFLSLFFFSSLTVKSHGVSRRVNSLSPPPFLREPEDSLLDYKRVRSISLIFNGIFQRVRQTPLPFSLPFVASGFAKDEAGWNFWGLREHTCAHVSRLLRRAVGLVRNGRRICGPPRRIMRNKNTRSLPLKRHYPATCRKAYALSHGELCTGHECREGSGPARL